MSRFGYLDHDPGGKKAAKKAKKLDKAAAAGKRADKRRQVRAEEDLHMAVEVVYVRRETIRAAWRELKAEGGESLSELVDDLLLTWLQDRQAARAAGALPESGDEDSEDEDREDGAREDGAREGADAKGAAKMLRGLSAGDAEQRGPVRRRPVRGRR